MFEKLVYIGLAWVIGYLAIYAGDGLNVWATAQDKIVIALVPGLVCTVFGVSAWIAWFHETEVYSDERFASKSLVIFAALSLVPMLFAFGDAASPFSSYGPYPWTWASAWDFLALLALVPMINLTFRWLKAPRVTT